MGHPSANPIARYLRQLAATEQHTPDAVVLAHYAQHQDDESFRLLLQRHGPMVLGVCRRVLGPTHDADDAFQATFLALARQAQHITANVGGWLHRVALRAAHKALRNAKTTSLRQDHPDVTDPIANIDWAEIRGLLDAELARLPNRLQAPLVLCYLDGLTRDEAAQRLGWSLRTLHRRLDEARQRLHARLTKRGLVTVALAIIVADGHLRACVPAELYRRTQQISATTPHVERLIPHVTFRGMTMKLLSATFAMAAIALGWGLAPRAEADPPPTLEPIQLVQVPKKTPTPRDPLLEQAGKAKDKAIAFLRKEQDKDGGWEKEAINLETVKGGSTSLVVLALLEAGVPVDDPMIKAGLGFIRKCKMAGTYAISLQTQALCKANQKEDAKLIQANVDWLEKAASRKGPKLIGWSYTEKSGDRGDGSNSRYAIVALYQAHKVGFKVRDKDFWNEVAALYFSTQQANGGWGYISMSPPSQTMTGSGLVCLWLAHDVIGKQTKESVAASDKGRIWLEENFKIEQNATYYFLDILAQLGSLTEQRKLTNRDKGLDWHRECLTWLLKKQQASGQFRGVSSYEDRAGIGTAFALRFLSVPMD